MTSVYVRLRLCHDADSGVSTSPCAIVDDDRRLETFAQPLANHPRITLSCHDAAAIK